MAVRNNEVRKAGTTASTAAAEAAPPRSLDEASTRISKVLGSKAAVSADPIEERVMLRFDAKDQPAIEKGLEFIGVKKSNTGIRDVYSFGQFEVALSPWQGASLA